MPNVDRRRFLQLAGGAAALTVLPTSIARAAEIPANRRTGSIRDIEHVVVLMQENRSFDHYFGTMRGVRGFGEPHPAVLPSGKSVWHQSDGTRDVLPFRPDQSDLGLAFIQDLDHSWDGGHQAFNGGNYDQWIPTKSSTTMAHLQRSDMPFHYALADAFTICDSYHCSLLGPTDPNRYYMWTGWVGNDGSGGGPVIANDELGYGWHTYPERLEDADVSWKIYQDVGVGLDGPGYWGWTSDPFIGNYGDNSLLYFDQYRTALPGSALYEKARTGTNAAAGQDFFEILESDVRGGRLPQVSWVVAPEAFTEHPNWPANYGAWYVSRVLDALTADPDVWSKTALLITFDENDGFFDHVVPPYPHSAVLPGASTVSVENELYRSSGSNGSTGVVGNYGVGQRVPMLVVSPWSTGGWVCSETFDHTSIIRFIEARFGVAEPNITPWRRAVCGDLTSAFDFGRTRTAVPVLPATAKYFPKNPRRHPDFVPVPPASGAVPRQEAGVRPSRPLGYQLDATPAITSSTLALRIQNLGQLGAAFQARSRTLADAPFSYTVAAGRSLRAQWPISGAYDLSLHGPDGFYRHLAGTAGQPAVEVTAWQNSRAEQLRVTVTNPSSSPARITVTDAYASEPQSILVAGHGTRSLVAGTHANGGWYDITVTSAADPTFARSYAGRLHNGKPGTSDPQLGG